MVEHTIRLIHRILEGDEKAFCTLVQKYQKRVHALAWRKIGEYHIAEEITQDTFIQVYKKLSTLRDPKQFDGWLYVIANRLCINWIKMNRPAMQSLEDTPVEEIEESFYKDHEAEQRRKETMDSYQNVVKKLLEKLPESERTVVTLYYLGEMTIREIGSFLGVSVNTVKSRLNRARTRLKQEEHILNDALSNFQLTTNITENLMREISRVKPVAPSVKNPLIPLAFGTVGIVILMLIIGIGSKNMVRFQKPYSLDAQSEMTVEIVEAPIVQDLEAKLNINNRPEQLTDIDGIDGTGVDSTNQDFDNQGNYTRWNLPEGAKFRLGKGTISDIAFSPEANRFAVATQIGIWVYDGGTGNEVALLNKLGRGISAVAFSPDGNIIAGASTHWLGGEVLLWDANNEKLIATFDAPMYIYDLFFSDDGTKLATTATMGEVRVWDISEAKNYPVIVNTKLELESWYQTQLIELSPDMRLLAITPKNGNNIQLWNAATGELLYTLTGHTRRVEAIAFSPDSKTLVSGDEAESIRMWNTETGNLESTNKWSHRFYTHTLAFSPNGKFLASGHNDGVQLWKYTQSAQHTAGDTIGNYEKSIRFSKHKDYVGQLVFSSDEKTALSVGKDGTIRAWDTTLGDERFICSGHIEGIRVLMLSESGDILTSLNRPYNPSGIFQKRRWNIKTGNLLSTDFLRINRVTTMEISPDNKLIAMHDVGGKCVLRDPNTDSLDIISRFSLKDYPRAGLNVKFAFSSDGKMLAAGGEGGSLNVWKVHAQSRPFLIRMFSGFKRMKLEFKVKHPDRIRSLSFSPNSKTLASSGYDKTVRLWNVADGTLLHIIRGHRYRVDTMAFSPDSKTLATGVDEVRLWDVETGREIVRIHEPSRMSVENVLFSPDGNSVIIGGWDGIKLYDIPSSNITNIQTSRISSLKFSADGKTMISESGAGSILIWDWEKLKSIQK